MWIGQKKSTMTHYESRPHKAEKLGKKMELRGLKIAGILGI